MPKFPSRWSRILRELESVVVSTILQTSCPGCNSDQLEPGFCRQCLEWNPLGECCCQSCGLPTSQSVSTCGECESAIRPTTQMRSAYWFLSRARVFLHRVKYGRQSLGIVQVADQIYRGVSREWIAGAALVPVPLHPIRLLERGFNQAALIAEIISRKFGVEAHHEVLVKDLPTLPQAKVKGSLRQKNLRGIFKLNRRVRIPERIILVDDVLTTGSTLNECARTLKEAGVKEVRAWTLFRAVPQRFQHEVLDVG